MSGRFVPANSPILRHRAHASVLAVTLALVLLSRLPSVAAADPVLMVMEHRLATDVVRVEIGVKAGMFESPQRGKPQPRWTLRPGDAMDTPGRPPDRVVALFQGPAASSELLCQVLIRYYADAKGRWVPHFQLQEEPAVVRAGTRWKPLTLNRGVPALVMLTSSTLPNAEGFFPSIEFALTTGPVAIDHWAVR